MNDNSASKKSSRETIKQNIKKNKNSQRLNGFSLTEQLKSKEDINKPSMKTTKGKKSTWEKPILPSPEEPILLSNGCENKQSKVGEEESLTTSLLNAQTILHGEKKIDNNNLLKKLLQSTLNDPTIFSPLDPSVEVEESDDEEEFVEYVFTPRRYFIYSVCEFCKIELNGHGIPCRQCKMTYYCSVKDMERDKDHIQLCSALTTIANNRGGYVYNNIDKISPEDYRAFRVMTMNSCEQILQRPLLPFEKEIIIFPRNCVHCREWRSEFLTECSTCGQVSCKNLPKEFIISHRQWCSPFSLLRKLIMFQRKNGQIDPDLPKTILRKSLNCKLTMAGVLKEINADQQDECCYAAITQIASAPLTVWYGLKLSQQLHKTKLTIHLIGAEMQFEADVMEKWELFILHITPAIQELNIVFIGPELVPRGISMQPLIKNKVCPTCHKDKRTVSLYFVDDMYHDYFESSSYKIPDLICFFNPGLYRTTGYNNTDSWPATIVAASRQKCPVLITSYTEYESPLDLQRFLEESYRPLNITLPPIQNPFSSCRPERNFISDEIVPLIFKNFYIFMVE